MEKSLIKIKNIPAVIWGEKSERVFIAVHGNMSHKEDTVINILAQAVSSKCWQVLSFDLPEHGERKEENTLCKAQVCVEELKAVMAYAKLYWRETGIFGCSIGAYFSLLAYKNEMVSKAMFLSPVTDMERLIRGMMAYSGVSEEQLQNEQEIAIPDAPALYWDYYCYVKEHPVDKWQIPTAILYGEKDELCEYDTIREFSERFACELDTVADTGHFFHTDSDFAILKGWINKNF